MRETKDDETYKIDIFLGEWGKLKVKAIKSTLGSEEKGKTVQYQEGTSIILVLSIPRTSAAISSNFMEVPFCQVLSLYSYWYNDDDALHTRGAMLEEQIWIYKG